MTPPKAVPPAIPQAVGPADYIPPSDSILPLALPKPRAPMPPPSLPPEKPDIPTVGRVVPASATQQIDAFPRMLAEAKSAYAKVRDYVGHYVRQEQVSGRLVPQETCELRVRTKPFCVSLKVVSPKEYANRETVYQSSRSTSGVRFKESNKLSYQPLAMDDPKVMADTRHVITDVGLLAVLNRVEAAVLIERRLNNPVQILVTDYTFADRPCERFEIFVERPHTHRYAHRHVLYVDKDTRLPVRYEAYDHPKPGAAVGELLEMQSFVGLKFNVGLGESAFDR